MDFRAFCYEFLGFPHSNEYLTQTAFQQNSICASYTHCIYAHTFIRIMHAKTEMSNCTNTENTKKAKCFFFYSQSLGRRLSLFPSINWTVRFRSLLSMSCVCILDVEFGFVNGSSKILMNKTTNTTTVSSISNGPSPEVFVV